MVFRVGATTTPQLILIEFIGSDGAKTDPKFNFGTTASCRATLGRYGPCHSLPERILERLAGLESSHSNHSNQEETLALSPKYEAPKRTAKQWFSNRQLLVGFTTALTPNSVARSSVGNAQRDWRRVTRKQRGC